MLKFSYVPTSIRLLAIDIDGTLLDPASQISPANLEALRRARESGVEIVLVTGRRYRFALPIARELGCDLWLISSNGAVIRSTGGETFFRDLMPVSRARHICAAMLEFRSSTVITFDVDEEGALVVESVAGFDPGIQRWMEKNAAHIRTVVPLEDALVADPIQVAFAGSLERMARVEARLQDSGLDGHITVLRTRYPARDLCFVDVLNGGCSKGHALERWARHRGLEPRQVMAIGDNYNDVEMLEFAGVPVIMGNAAEDLKQNGWAITRSNDQDGVAAALEEFLR